MKSKKPIAFFFLFILFVSAFTFLASTTSSAASPDYSVAITLTNSQSSATPTDFSQMLKVNWSSYSDDLNSNISNVRFYYSSSFSASTELAGWIESNNTTTATSSNVWVNLSSNIIPASGSLTIYMTFLPATASWSSHWGLAPQLSSPYGKFDNGANVFPLYANGNTPVSDFNYYSGISIAQATGVTYGSTTINVLQITGNNGGTGSYQISLKKPTTINNLIAESNFQQVNYGTGASQGEIAIANSNSTATSTNAIDVSMGWGKSYFSQDYMSGGAVTDDLNQAGTNNGNWNYASVQTLSGSTSFYGYIAPQLYSTSGGYSATETAANPISASSNYYIGLGISPTSSSYPWDSNINWMRARAYPPAGVMPSVSFGSLKAVVVSGHQISFSQTTLSSTAQWGIHLNNTTSNSWLNETGEYINFTGLNNGAYTYHVINAVGYASNPSNGVITINNANVSQSLHFQGYYMNFTESGLPSGTEWYVNLSNQPGLSESSSGQHLSGTSTTISTHLPNGTYSATYQTGDKRYHTAGIGSFTVDAQNGNESVVFSPYLYFMNFTQISKPISLLWGVNLSGSIKSGTGNLSFQETNGTYFFNSSALDGSWNNPEGWWRLTNDSGGSNSVVMLHNESSFGGVKETINGANINNQITFEKAYNISFQEVGINNGYQWDVNLSNGLGATLDKSIIVSNTVTQVEFKSYEGNYTNGSFSGSIQNLVYGPAGIRFQNFTNPASFSISVSGKNPVNITNFISQYYLTTNSRPSIGGTNAPNSAWFNQSTQVTLIAMANANYQFTGWVGSGVSSYTGMGTYALGEYTQTITMTNPISETAVFNNYVLLTFFMKGLPQNTKWGIELSQNGNLLQWDNGTSSFIYFDLAQGSYTYQVSGISSYPQSGNVSLSSSESVGLQYELQTYYIYFNESGLPSGTIWGITVASGSSAISTIHSNGPSIIYNLPNGSYTYVFSSIAGYGTNNSSGNFIVSGKPININTTWTEGNYLIRKGIVDLVPITLNTTNFTIPSGAQIPIDINWFKYNSIETSNLSNVMILNSSYIPLYAWIQNNATSTATSSNVWVKLREGITYQSSQLIYLVFMPKNVNNFDPIGYWGEAPQLSSRYGVNNNIQMVMNPGLIGQIYTNFSMPNTGYDVVPSNSILNSSGYSENSYITADGARYYADQPYFSTPITGATRNLSYPTSYETNPNGVSGEWVSISFYGTENNVLFSYQYENNYLDGTNSNTFPDPPVAGVFAATQPWFIKFQGFVVQNTAQTHWYSMSDSLNYIAISNSTSNNYYSGWASGNTIINSLVPYNDWASPPSSPYTGQSNIQGSAEFSSLYVSAGAPTQNLEGNGYVALYQFWASSSVSYYSPIPLINLPNVSIGQVVSSYSSFFEYGLPSNTNWSIAISGLGYLKLFTSDTNVIYTYLPAGTYIYTVGSMINGSYHSGIVGQYIPSPATGHVIITNTFTVQVIIFSVNKVLKYNLDPEQASGVSNNVTLPILVVNIQGLPASNSTITMLLRSLTAELIAKDQKENQNLTWSISSSKNGMIVIFLHIGRLEIQAIENGTAVVSFVAAFQQGTISQVAAGIAGPSVFSGVSQSISNSNTSKAPGLNLSSPSSTVSSLEKNLNYYLTAVFGQGPLWVHLSEIATITFALTAAVYVERIRSMNDEAQRHIKWLRKQRKELKKEGGRKRK